MRACAAARVPITCISEEDPQHLLRAAELAGASAGKSAPHPNVGCVIARGIQVVGEGFLYGQGTRSAEIQAVSRAGEFSKGATAYLNLEPEVYHGQAYGSAVHALKEAGLARVVVGLRHPLQHLRGRAIDTLRSSGVCVEVGGEELNTEGIFKEALRACQVVNAPLLYRAAYKIPFSILKFAMTLDGKIASSTGHAAWVSSELSRERVFSTRAVSDAVIVGGNTVRRDNPRLTTRHRGHLPVRIVMSRCLRLPENANLWDVSIAQTIVMTQRGVRKDFQTLLASRGVEVVEFDFLTPRAVMEYCYHRGFLSVLWECGGMLSAPAISSGVIHKVMAFVAPKIIGGSAAPSPVGELGMVEMNQALKLSDVTFEQIGPDMLISGYVHPIPNLNQSVSPTVEAATSLLDNLSSSKQPPVISFYKTWDPYGEFSNFFPHSISLSDRNGKVLVWKSVEHYYQAQKFEGVEDPLAEACVRNIKEAEGPEEAAQLGRSLARQRPDLVTVLTL